MLSPDAWIVRRVLAAWVPFRRARGAGAAAVTMLGATSFTAWKQSAVNETVYTVSLLGIALVSCVLGFSVLAVTLIPLVANAGQASRRGKTTTRE